MNQRMDIAEMWRKIHLLRTHTHITLNTAKKNVQI